MTLGKIIILFCVYKLIAKFPVIDFPRKENNISNAYILVKKMGNTSLQAALIFPQN